ncbi:hypothetical protein SVAN01_08478 [Stagonosporopsis vannaccii]|nr:hypothetical protein SVAN01_08478 [Stagonosporopsis vannaccii]
MAWTSEQQLKFETRDRDSGLVIAYQTQATRTRECETSNGRQCGSEFLAARSRQCTRHYCLGPPDRREAIVCQTLILGVLNSSVVPPAKRVSQHTPTAQCQTPPQHPNGSSQVQRHAPARRIHRPLTTGRSFNLRPPGLHLPLHTLVVKHTGATARVNHAANLLPSILEIPACQAFDST